MEIMEIGMNANCRKLKGLFSLLSLSVLLSTTPMNLLAEDSKAEEVQTQEDIKDWRSKYVGCIKCRSSSPVRYGHCYG